MTNAFIQETKIKSFPKKRKSTNNMMPYIYDKIHFKTYPRFKSIKFNNINSISEFEKILLKRSSDRTFNKKPLSLKELEKILYFSSGISRIIKNNLNNSRRPYPSAGARYPLEIYPVILKLKGVNPGVYHYNVKSNSLEMLLEGKPKNIFSYLDQKWTKKASVIILISAVFARTTIKYSSRGYRYVFLDAGHLMQNLYLISTSIGLNCCSIGGFLDDKFNEMLDINGKNESVIYIVAIGKK